MSTLVSGGQNYLNANSVTSMFIRSEHARERTEVALRNFGNAVVNFENHLNARRIPAKTSTVTGVVSHGILTSCALLGSTYFFTSTLPLELSLVMGGVVAGVLSGIAAVGICYVQGYLRTFIDRPMTQETDSYHRELNRVALKCMYDGACMIYCGLVASIVPFFSTHALAVAVFSAFCCGAATEVYLNRGIG